MFLSTNIAALFTATGAAPSLDRTSRQLRILRPGFLTGEKAVHPKLAAKCAENTISLGLRRLSVRWFGRLHCELDQDGLLEDDFEVYIGAVALLG